MLLVNIYPYIWQLRWNGSFLQTYKLPKHSEEEIDKLFHIEDIAFVVKNFLTKKTPSPDSFTTKFNHLWRKHLWKKYNTIQSLAENRRKHSNTFMRSLITTKLQNHTKTLQQENYRPISFVNTHEKKLENWIHQCIFKKVIYQSVRFILGMQGHK